MDKLILSITFISKREIFIFLNFRFNKLNNLLIKPNKIKLLNRHLIGIAIFDSSNELKPKLFNFETNAFCCLFVLPNLWPIRKRFSFISSKDSSKSSKSFNSLLILSLLNFSKPQTT